MTIVNNAFNNSPTALRSISKRGIHASQTLASQAKKGNKLNYGWTINISAGYRFAASAEHQVQISYSRYIRPLLNTTKPNYAEIAQTLINKQFEFLCALLRANTCKVIYFDAAFTDAQLAQIRVLQSCSKSELINTRMAYMFNQKQHA